MINLLVLGLATLRLSLLLAEEAGPWDVLARLRYRVGVRYDEASQPYGTTMIARGVLCVYCNSVWLGFLLAGAYLLAPNIAFFVSLPFALSAFAIIPRLR